jgi:hypothetical protein
VIQKFLAQIWKKIIRICNTGWRWGEEERQKRRKLFFAAFLLSIFSMVNGILMAHLLPSLLCFFLKPEA